MIIHLFFYRNRCGRIWSNMSSQPKRVFKLGYHIEYYTFLKKKRNIFISFNMSWNTIYRHFIKWRYILQTKIFFFISASRSKSENYLPYLNMKKKLPPLFITCSLLLNYSKVSVWYIHNKDIGRMYSFCHIIYPKYVFDTIIQCCPNEYTTLEACIAKTLWTKIRYTSFSLGDISDKRTINNSNDFNKFWFVLEFITLHFTIR